jgi:hypothetical protein
MTLQPPRYSMDLRSHRDDDAAGMLFSLHIGSEITLDVRIAASPRTCSLSPDDIHRTADCLRGFVHGYFGRPAEHPLRENPMPEHRAYDFGFMAGSQQQEAE